MKTAEAAACSVFRNDGAGYISSTHLLESIISDPEQREVYMKKNVCISILLSVFLSTGNVCAGFFSEEADTLRAVIAVDTVIEDLDETSLWYGLSEDRLEEDIEQQLQEAGIETVNDVLVPMLYINIRSYAFSPLYIMYRLDLKLYQHVSIVDNPAVECLAVTWERGFLGGVNTFMFSERIAGKLEEHIDEFVEDYHDVNQ